MLAQAPLDLGSEKFLSRTHIPALELPNSMVNSREFFWLIYERFLAYLTPELEILNVPFNIPW
ncbi:MAG TPA: hypothetical protein VJK50_00810 [Patescibacteria group bacterium]|nr:hypothetical protein [Patescibacteria group bacterium]